MKVESILTQARACKTQHDADDLLEHLENTFAYTKPLFNMQSQNPEACMEGDTALARLELSHLISRHYGAEIGIQVRENALSITVVIQRLRDGLGRGSHCWEAVDGSEHVIEADADQEIEALAEQASKLAIASHAELLERAGLAPGVALKTAQDLWLA